MEDKSPTPERHSQESVLWYKSTPFRILVIILICVLGYFGIKQISKASSSKSIFTQYDPLYTDSTDLALDSITDESGKIGLNDSIQVDTSILTRNPNQANKDSLEIDLFSVNTSYENIKSGYDADIADITTNSVMPESGLFEELLLPENLRGSNNPAFRTFYEKNILSPKSILRLLPIAGKNILINNNSTDDEAILDLLTESESVVAILVINRKGIVIYSTNRKQLNRPIKALMPRIETSKTTLSWHQENNHNIVSLPLFHTYGKIGAVVLISERE